MISILVPVYNVEKYLHRCIDSILAQTYTDYEVILVNDGSTDRSGAICDAYAAEHRCIRVIHQKNGGVAQARNVLVSAAQGDYITFVDSDDSIEPIYLETLMRDYSLRYDKESYIVWYDCFADNVIPDIEVRIRQQ